MTAGAVCKHVHAVFNAVISPDHSSPCLPAAEVRSIHVLAARSGDWA